MTAYMALGVGVPIVAFVFAYLSLNIDKKHGPMQMFFMFISLFMLYIEGPVLLQIAKAEALTELQGIISGAYMQTMTFVLILFVGYMLIYFIWNTLMETTESLGE